MEYILELPAWTVNLPRGVHSAFIADILHVEGVMYVVLEHLSAGDLLKFRGCVPSLQVRCTTTVT